MRLIVAVLAGAFSPYDRKRKAEEIKKKKLKENNQKRIQLVRRQRLARPSKLENLNGSVRGHSASAAAASFIGSFVYVP